MRLIHVISLLVFTLVAVILSLGFLESYSKPITFESIESENIKGVPVINSVRYKKTKKSEIWYMRQNHYDGNEPDDLKITVNREGDFKKASFSQYENGEEGEFRASCFLCHANGPRAIRYNSNSKKAPLSTLEKIVIAFWNFKIKHNGEVKTDQNIHIADKVRNVPLKYEGRLDTREIKLESCNLCHGKDSLMGRSELQFQHAGTIKHLVETEQMPPLFFTISKEDKEFLRHELNINIL